MKRPVKIKLVIVISFAWLIFKLVIGQIEIELNGQYHVKVNDTHTAP